MKEYLVHVPIVVCEDEIREFVTGLNIDLIRRNPDAEAIHATIGNPNTFLSQEICDMLTEAGMLTREPVLDENGKQSKIKLDGSPLLWHYTWTDKTFAVLSEEQITALAWDLRANPYMCHISGVLEIETTETSLDCSEPSGTLVEPNPNDSTD